MSGKAVSGNFRSADHPDHCRSGPLESPPQSLEPGCGFVEAFEHVDLAVLADKRDGESVAVRMKAEAPSQDGVRRRIQRGESLLDAGFHIDPDQPLNRGLRRRVPVKIEWWLTKNAGSWGHWSRAEPVKRRNHSGATTGP